MCDFLLWTGNVKVFCFFLIVSPVQGKKGRVVTALCTDYSRDLLTDGHVT